MSKGSKGLETYRVFLRKLIELEEGRAVWFYETDIPKEKMRSMLRGMEMVLGITEDRMEEEERMIRRKVLRMKKLR